LTLARGRHPAMTAPPPRAPGRLRVPRRCPGPRLTGRPTAPRSARPRPMPSPRTGRQVPGRPIRRPVGCRRSRRRRRPGPDPKAVPPDLTRGPRGPRAFRAPRGRRGPRSPRPTSAARGRLKGAKGVRPGLPVRVPVRRAVHRGSARVPRRAVPTRAVRAARAPGRPRRGPRDPVLPGRVRPGRVDPVRARALRVPARGRATTRLVRPRPVWGRHLPLGPRAQACLASGAIPAVPARRPAARAPPVAQGVRVPLGAVRAVPACPMAARVRAGPRPGGPRPSPMNMPSRPAPSGAGRGGPGGAGRGGPGAGAGTRPGGGGGGGGRGPGAGGPGAGAGAPRAGAGGGPPRPGGGRGRSGTQGAFGRPGGRPSRGRKSKKQRRQEFDNMQAPSIGGVQVPRGNGQVVRLSRGASLSDFADKIGANPASLVQVMLHLGEMVTATQSVNDETLQLLGAELNYNIQVVSPEEEDRELLESFDI